MNITNNVIQQAISNNRKTTAIITDGILSGFGVRIYYCGAVSYFVEPTNNGKSNVKAIDKYPALSC